MAKSWHLFMSMAQHGIITRNECELCYSIQFVRKYDDWQIQFVFSPSFKLFQKNSVDVRLNI